MDADNIFLQNAKVELQKSDAKLGRTRRFVKFTKPFFVIGIDNHASKTMSNDIKHFITSLSSTPNTFVKGTLGYVKEMGSGTL